MQNVSGVMENQDLFYVNMKRKQTYAIFKYFSE